LHISFKGFVAAVMAGIDYTSLFGSDGAQKISCQFRVNERLVMHAVAMASARSLEPPTPSSEQWGFLYLISIFCVPTLPAVAMAAVVEAFNPLPPHLNNGAFCI
jgi:hypothetical protein